MISLCGDCRCVYGCIGNCVPGYQIPAHSPAHLDKTIRPYVPVRGCICPAGANKDCESPVCPRKDLLGIMAEKRQV